MYVTLKQFAEAYPWPSLSALKSIYFDATKEKNPYIPAFSKAGRRVVIDPDKFFNLIEEHGKSKKQEIS